MAKKRVSRSRKRELETPDEFITFSQQLIGIAAAHKEKLITIVGVIVVLIIGFVGKQHFSERAENKVSALLGQSMAKYQAIKRKTSPEEAYVGAEKDFQQMLEKYSGSRGGKIARLMFADICYNGGHYDRAIQLYTTSLEEFAGVPFVENMILSSLGYAHEKKKNYPEAIKYFEMSVQGSDSAMKSDALFNLGVLYAEMGRHEKSTEAFKKIVVDHSDSIYYDIARGRLAG